MKTTFLRPLLLVLLLALLPLAGRAEDLDGKQLLPIQRKIMRLIAERNAALAATQASRPMRPQYCFAPGTPESYIQRVTAASLPAGASKHYRVDEPPEHWEFTATDGDGIARGDAITLTWSIVPDGTMVPGLNRAPNSPSDLRARLNQLYGDEQTWLPLFQQVFDRWQELTGITYVYEPNDDGAAFSSFSVGGDAQPGVLGTRGDVRIGGRALDGNSGTLAFNFGAPNGEMVIDTNDDAFEDMSNNSRLFRNTVSHEHGHGLGLNHTCPENETKIMEPTVPKVFDGPQHDDILGAQRQHGDPRENNDTFATATDLGALAEGTITANTVLGGQFLSLDGSDDVDIFKFTVPASRKKAAVTLRPIGESYLEAAQNPDGSCPPGFMIDSRLNQNLGVEIVGFDAKTVLGSANVNPAGQNETLVDIALTGGTGPFFVRVFGGAEDDVQMYEFDLAIADDPTQIDDLSVTLAAAPASVRQGSTVVYTARVFNPGPGVATAVTLTDALPGSASFVSASASQGSVSESAGTVTANLGSLPPETAAFVTVNLTATPPGALMNAVSVSRAEPDPDTANNTSAVTISVTPGPDDVEEFSAFPGFSGFFTGATVANDTGTDFGFLNFGSGGTTTATGFGLDAGAPPNGRGLTVEAAEGSGMWNEADISPSKYTRTTHMLAFWFRFTDNTAAGADHSTQILTVFNQAAANNVQFAYIFVAGTDSTGNSGAGLILPKASGGNIEYPHASATPNEWHKAVIQYRSASSPSVDDGGLDLWIDPTHGGAHPTLSFGVGGNELTSRNPGPFGKYGFGQVALGGDLDGPTIFIDSIGSWDGFGTAGVNDLQAGVDFLNSSIPNLAIAATSAAKVEGDSSSTQFDFIVTRTGPNAVFTTVNYAVTGSGAHPAAAADFGGSFPTGSVTFAPGETSKGVSIAVSGDGDVEPDEEFTVTISVPAGGAIVNVTAATGTIQNDDAAAVFDFGDAPDPLASTAGQYPTLLANEGARHQIVVNAPRLGSEVDSESDGQPDAGAMGDDANSSPDDEDGVAAPTLIVGSAIAIPVTVSVAAGKLDAWIDFNQNGVWESPSEQIATGLDAPIGTTMVMASVPQGALVGGTFARFRLSSAGGLAPTGSASDGEVEDHRVLVIAGSLPAADHITIPTTDASGNVTVVFQGTAGAVYEIQTSDTLQPDSWTTIATVTADANGVVFHQDLSVGALPRRFYRTKKQ